ncbi:uncharacterized protein LOC107013479 [Solanum pennellii]|uniref:Uncharacterized protein LOC107013479 n=1 Tax=Solanum pennellii TaxID=28526 RepID=A0ABM1GBU3_SOLPN|nr:uncharacterized protein LOC107013479 [Solanum pennellii]
MGSASHVDAGKKDLVKDVHRLARFGVRLEDSPNGGFWVHHNSNLSLVVKVKSKQHLDPSLIELKETVAYELRLPSELASVHPILDLSMLKKCIGDPEYILPIEGIDVDENLSYEEVPVEILDQQIQKLKNKEVASLMVVVKKEIPQMVMFSSYMK